MWTSSPSLHWMYFSISPVFNMFTGNACSLHFIEHLFKARHWARDKRLHIKDEQDRSLPTTNSWSRHFSTWCVWKRMAPKSCFAHQKKGAQLSPNWSECLTFKPFLTQGSWLIAYIMHNKFESLWIWKYTMLHLDGLYLCSHFCHTIFIQMNVRFHRLNLLWKPWCGSGRVGGRSREECEGDGKKKLEDGEMFLGIYSASSGWAPQSSSNFLARKELSYGW